MGLVKVYSVSGWFKDRSNVWRKFRIEVTAINEGDAREKVYTRIGGGHKVPRNLIKVESITEVNPSEVKDRYIKQLLSLDKLVTW
ncbi:50S ribosomal protein L18Ae [Caldivirga sp. UBA161]|uniref:50S ribosomal protein L18Ae n=1 Tax=Caldivirga sp. UBA161 TaxID=1915569 RepID=UPI0025C64EA3|nr:50S ribosomal protein L18Ae [Caldivirga sp. UBA161]